MSVAEIKPRRGTPFDQMAKSALVAKSVRAADTHPEQRLRALQRANDRRLAAADMKSYVKSMRALPKEEAWKRAAALLRRCPEAMEPMELHEFLEAVPGVGKERMKKMCQGTRVWPLDRLGEIPVWTRRKIADRLETGGWA